MIEKSTLLHFSVYMVKASAKQFDGAVGLLQSEGPQVLVQLAAQAAAAPPVVPPCLVLISFFVLADL